MTTNAPAPAGAAPPPEGRHLRPSRTTRLSGSVRSHCSGPAGAKSSGAKRANVRAKTMNILTFASHVSTPQMALPTSVKAKSAEQKQNEHLRFLRVAPDELHPALDEKKADGRPLSEPSGTASRGSSPREARITTAQRAERATKPRCAHERGDEPEPNRKVDPSQDRCRSSRKASASGFQDQRTRRPRRRPGASWKPRPTAPSRNGRIRGIEIPRPAKGTSRPTASAAAGERSTTSPAPICVHPRRQRKRVDLRPRAPGGRG